MENEVIHAVVDRGPYSKKPVSVWCGVPVKAWKAGETIAPPYFAPFWTNAPNCPECERVFEEAKARNAKINAQAVA